MVTEPFGPYYPLGIRNSREIDALPVDGCILIVGTHVIARHFRDVIRDRRGARVASQTDVLSMGCRDLSALLIGAQKPIVLSWMVRRHAGASRLANLEVLAAAANAWLIGLADGGRFSQSPSKSAQNT